MEHFPGNSHTSKIVQQKVPETESVTSEEASEPKKVVTQAIQRKKPLGDRFKNMFFSDSENFAEHLVENVIAPMAKDMALSIITQVVDAVRQGVEQALFGETRPRSSGRMNGYGSGRPVVNYNRISSGTSIRRDTPPRPVRRSNAVEDLILPSRDTAQRVLEELDAKIDTLGHCTVGDLYDLVDVAPSSVDHSWGWIDVSQAQISKIAFNEFLLSMPRPRSIEN